MPDRLSALCLAILLAVPHCVRLDDEVFAPPLQAAIGDRAGNAGTGRAPALRVAAPKPCDAAGSSDVTIQDSPQRSHPAACAAR